MRERSPELASIRKLIDLYIDGVKNANVASLRRAFHPRSSMYGYKGDDLHMTPIEGLYEHVTGTIPPAGDREPGGVCECTITCIHLVGNAASVEMAMDGYDGHNFMDYLHVLKVEGRWWIVSKLFHADPVSSQKSVRCTR